MKLFVSTKIICSFCHPFFENYWFIDPRSGVDGEAAVQGRRDRLPELLLCGAVCRRSGALLLMLNHRNKAHQSCRGAVCVTSPREIW